MFQKWLFAAAGGFDGYQHGSDPFPSFSCWISCHEFGIISHACWAMCAMLQCSAAIFSYQSSLRLPRWTQGAAARSLDIDRMTLVIWRAHHAVPSVRSPLESLGDGACRSCLRRTCTSGVQRCCDAWAVPSWFLFVNECFTWLTVDKEGFRVWPCTMGPSTC